MTPERINLPLAEEIATTSHTDSHNTSVMERMPRPIKDVGITEVYCPAQSDATVADIVFVHGLMGHPKDTWLLGKKSKAPPPVVPGDTVQKSSSWTKFFGRKKSGGDTSKAPVEDPEYCFWPYDLLPKDGVISHARILLYGYDSHPTHFYKDNTTRMTITQHAEDLMHKVNAVRGESPRRPLIFIAHSLGGILVKGALNESRQMSQSPYYDLYSSCQAIMFMGTPHLGSSAASWGTFMSDLVGALPGGFTTYSKLLRSLQPDSETLYMITRRFNDILDPLIPNFKKVQICNVQEGQGMSRVKGAGSKVVPDDSSKFNRPGIEQSFFNQTANHMTMCKFSSADDQGYEDVLKVLQGYIRAIQEDHAEIQRAVDTDTQAEVSDFLKKLDFDGRLARQRQLNTLVTTEHSFDWVWESSFVNWLRCDAKLFWIAGKPASGKSTLVNHIMRHHRTKKIMEGAHGGGLVIAKFFFDFRAKDGIGNNFEGLRKSLLYQLLQTSSALAVEVMQHFGADWLDDQIMVADPAVLEYALDKNDRPTLFFVDGLDEYEGDKPAFVSLIRRITTFKVKVCLSSRYEPPFTMTYKDRDFRFRMESLNKSGIYAYTKDRLVETLRPSNEEERSELDMACGDISESSAGVFLWACFAVSTVIVRTCEGHEIDYKWLRAIVYSMPPELGDIYARIVQHMSSKHKKACGIILALINSAEQTLELSELFEATLLAGGKFRSLDKAVTSKVLDSFQRHLETVGAGIIHCYVRSGEHTCTYVTMVHRTMQTYLNSTGWKQLLGEQQTLGAHHELWLNICRNFLTGIRVRWIVPSRIHDDIDDGTHEPIRRTPPSPSIGLHKYVYTLLPYHAYHYEQETKRSSLPMIQKVLSPDYIRRHICTAVDRDSRLSCNFGCRKAAEACLHAAALCSDVQLAVSHRLSLYVKEALRRHPEAFASDSFVSAVLNAESKLEEIGRKIYSSQVPRAFIEPPERWRASALYGPKASPLATAVIWRCLFPDSERSNFVLLLPSHSSRLRDVDTLMAISSLSMVEIEALLIHFPQGPLYLYSPLRRHLTAEHWIREGNRMTAEYPYGPLWEVGERDEVKSIAQILRFFLHRGEKINSQCGPKGTILHSTVLVPDTSRVFDQIGGD